MTDQPQHVPGAFSFITSRGRLATGRATVHHDPRTLMLHNYLVASQLPPLEDKVDYSARAQWMMGHNDVLGDCVQVGRCNGLKLVAALAQQTLPLDDNTPVTAYSQDCGYRTGDSSTDNGCVELDVLNRWQQGEQLAGVGLEAFVGVQPQSGDFAVVRYAIQLFGFCLLGLDMPRAWQTQVGGTWDAGAANGTNYATGYEPGSWGGHCIILVGFDWTGDRKQFTGITWAMKQIITREAMLGYCDERYALLTSLWKDHVPEGAIAYDLMMSDLQEIKSGTQ